MSPPILNLHTGKLINFFVFVGQQISAIEGRARNDLKRWKLECTSTIKSGRNGFVENL